MSSAAKRPHSPPNEPPPATPRLNMRAFVFALIVLAIQPAIAPAGRAATLGDPRVGFSAERVLVYDGHRYVGRMWSMPGEQRHEQQLPSLKPVFILRADSTVADVLLPQLHTAVEFVLPTALSASWRSRPCSASRSGTRSSTASPPPDTRSTRRSPRGACPAGCGSAATASRCAATAASPARTGRSRRCIGNCATSASGRRMPHCSRCRPGIRNCRRRRRRPCSGCASRITAKSCNDQAVARGCGRRRAGRAGVPLKRSHEALDTGLRKPNGWRGVRRGARSEGIDRMNRALTALIVSAGISLAAADAASGARRRADPRGEQRRAGHERRRVVSRITPGVVNIAVRGEVREQNPLVQDPFFRQFFNFRRPADRARDPGDRLRRHRRCRAGLCADQRPRRRERHRHRGHHQGQPPLHGAS